MPTNRDIQFLGSEAKYNEFVNAIEEHQEQNQSEFQKALTATQKIRAKHVDKQERKKLQEEVQNRFEASGVIHNEKRLMRIPGPIPPPSLFFLNPTLPMLIEGLLQEKLWKIQGYNY